MANDWTPDAEPDEPVDEPATPEPAAPAPKWDWFETWQRGEYATLTGKGGKTAEVEIAVVDTGPEIRLTRAPAVPPAKDRELQPSKLPLDKGKAVVIGKSKADAVGRVIQAMRGGDAAPDCKVITLDDAAGMLRATIVPSTAANGYDSWEVFSEDTTILRGAVPTKAAVRLWLADLVNDHGADAVVIAEPITMLTLRVLGERDTNNPDGCARIAARLEALAAESGAAIAVVEV